MAENSCAGAALHAPVLARRQLAGPAEKCKAAPCTDPAPSLCTLQVLATRYKARMLANSDAGSRYQKRVLAAEERELLQARKRREEEAADRQAREKEQKRKERHGKASGMKDAAKQQVHPQRTRTHCALAACMRCTPPARTASFLTLLSGWYPLRRPSKNEPHCFLI